MTAGVFFKTFPPGNTTLCSCALAGYFLQPWCSWENWNVDIMSGFEKTGSTAPSGQAVLALACGWQEDLTLIRLIALWGKMSCLSAGFLTSILPCWVAVLLSWLAQSGSMLQQQKQFFFFFKNLKINTQPHGGFVDSLNSNLRLSAAVFWGFSQWQVCNTDTGSRSQQFRLFLMWKMFFCEGWLRSLLQSQQVDHCHTPVSSSHFYRHDKWHQI